MPELPEVETIRLGLQDKIIGLRILDIEIGVAKIFQGDPKEVIGAKIKNISRRAKILIFDLDNGKSLVIHLKLTGQLVYHKLLRSRTAEYPFGQVSSLLRSSPQQAARYSRSLNKKGASATFGHPIPFAGTILPAKTTHVIFTFSDGSKLFYNDVRKFGWIKIVQSSKLKVQSFLKDLGPEPPVTDSSENNLTIEQFNNMASKGNIPIKVLLMDQKKIAGVGNIYANEALFDAGIDPRRKAKKLSNEEIKKLYASILKVLKEGIKYGGSSENAYVNALGDFGKMQEHFRVYNRKGESCPNRCGGIIKRITLGGRGTFFCEKCQK
ncbi:MAG: bifunctional DNA-formamidopyrimidine glycosylase/DNA-(apurinic or apyrimidinic site) lyase [Candidatus Levybacteria bacterium]|nr:bifunctional DNA-formamidopyrimidine glycosylase/DNA-(apurinic or apyrimidinic site) lyase [Candidatus Levybacteria bacterium]